MEQNCGKLNIQTSRTEVRTSKEEDTVTAWEWGRASGEAHKKENFPEGERNPQCRYCPENNNGKSETRKHFVC